MVYQERLMRQLWLSLIEDMTDKPTTIMMEVYFKQSKDILALIAESVTVADDLIQRRESTQPYSKFNAIVRYFLGVDPNHISCLGSIELDPDAFEATLLCLRFPKRYTPQSGVPSSIPEFWNTNRRLRQLESRLNPNSMIISYMRYFLHKWYDNDETRTAVKERIFLPSTGDDLEGHKDVLEKVEYLEGYDTLVMNGIYGGDIRYSRHYKYCTNKITSVPKSYKTKRNIAVESQFTTYKATPVAKALEQGLPEFVSVRDQDRNQELALEGSYDNSLATIDLSAASDSNACVLCKYTLPGFLYRALLTCTSIAPQKNCDDSPCTYDPSLVINDRIRGFGYHMISTMGNRVTFPLEEAIFSAAIATAYALMDLDYEDYIDVTAVYGDDMIVPVFLVETLIGVLESIGFLPNTDKSFYGNEFFRESCGCEFYKGNDVSSLYWPRKEVKEDDLAILIGLQHKFFEYPRTNMVLCKEIRRLYPAMTESLPDSPYDDIWTYYPDIRSAFGSYDRKRDPHSGEDEPSCELHVTLQVPKTGRVTELSHRIALRNFLANPDKGLTGDPVLDSIGYREPCDLTQYGRPKDTKPRPVIRKYLP